MIDITQKTARWGLKEYFFLSIKGFVVGAIDVVAGVSGGTMAIIVGIYSDILHALHRFDLHALKLLVRGKIRELLAYILWKFLAAISIGIFLAILSMARVLDAALARAPLYTWSLLFGLLAASAFYVRTYIRKHTATTSLLMLLGAVISYFFVSLIPTHTPEAGWFIILTGLIAVCAALLPGLSGAFTLIILGKYEYILEAISTRNIPVILLFGVGVAIGLLTFVRVITWLLDHHNDIVMATLTGLMIGSIRKVWPWHTDGATTNYLPTWSAEVGMAMVCTVIGFLFVVGIHALAKKITPEEAEKQKV